MSIGDLLRIKIRIWRDQMDVIRYFYRNPRYALLDLSLGFFSLFSNPYRVCRKFLQKKGETEIYAYGETPLITLRKIAKQVQLTSSDRWLELGSGRGKGCFWIAQFIRCETLGIEWVPPFVRRARFLKSFFRYRNLSFQLLNMEEADFASATAVYLYGTCLEKEKIDRLVEKMEKLPSGARVVSISYSLESSFFSLEKTFSVHYPWGETEAFLQVKK